MSTPRWVRRTQGSNGGGSGPNDRIGRVNLLSSETPLRALREGTRCTSTAFSIWA